MNQAVIAVGSNIDPVRNIKKASTLLSKSQKFVKKSAFARTEPILYENQPDFMNGAFLIETELPLDDLVKWLKSVEKQLGRKPSENKYGPRPIDLDVVVWNGELIGKDFYERDFVKKAVLELLPSINY